MKRARSGLYRPLALWTNTPFPRMLLHLYAWFLKYNMKIKVKNNNLVYSMPDEDGDRIEHEFSGWPEEARLLKKFAINRENKSESKKRICK